MKSMNTKRLSLNALLAAMCAVLGMISLNTGNLKLSFEGLPVLVGALLFGPVDGMLIGGIGTLLYQGVRFGLMVTTVLWVVPYVVCGLLAGLYARKWGFKLSTKQLVFITCAVNILEFLLNTLALYLDSRFWGYTFVYVIGATIPRIAVCVAKAAVYTAIMPAVLRAANLARRGR